MGCIYEAESMNREKLIEILVEKRKRSVLLKEPSDSDSLVLVAKESKELQEEFYSDINDESKLIKYLESLQKMKIKKNLIMNYCFILMLFLQLIKLNSLELMDLILLSTSLKILLRIWAFLDLMK